MYVISIALAIFGLLSWGNISAQNASNVASQQDITSKIALESKELLTFAQGALDLTTEIGAAGGGESISLATLESNHLLPISFPTETPFGQTWNAFYVLDHTTGLADLLIWPSGSVEYAGNMSSQYIAARVVQRLSSLQDNLQTSNQFLIGNGINQIYLGTSVNNTLIISSGFQTIPLSERCGNAITNYEPVMFIDFTNP